MEIFFQSLLLSCQVALAATALALVCASPVSYLLALKKFKGKELVDNLLLLPLVMPPTVTGYFLLKVFGRYGLIGQPLFEATGMSVMFHWTGAVLAAFVVSAPLTIKVMRSSFEAVDPQLQEAARSFGHSSFSIACFILFPLARQGIMAAAVLTFARSIGEFGATMMLAGNIPGKTETMPLLIYNQAAAGLDENVAWIAAGFGVFTFVIILLAKRLLLKKEPRPGVPL
jgi:molybdate transport system permease protein